MMKISLKYNIHQKYELDHDNEYMINVDKYNTYIRYDREKIGEMNKVGIKFIVGYPNY